MSLTVVEEAQPQNAPNFQKAVCHLTGAAEGQTKRKSFVNDSFEPASVTSIWTKNDTKKNQQKPVGVNMLFVDKAHEIHTR